MAAGTMATAAGVAVLLYYVLSKKLAASKIEREDDEEEFSSSRVSSRTTVRRTVSARRPAHAPATWLEALSMLSDTLRFTYAETLGKWPIADLAFGINYLMRRQGDLQVASVYAGQNCVQLRGFRIVEELKNLLRLMTLCMYFSKKPFPVFLECSGYSLEDVLLQKPKAGLLKPAFTIIRDESSKCFLLLIRGTHSIKDTLTAVTGGVVPFHHSVLHDGGVSNLILGYAHCGMVASARWIAKLSIPCLLNALAKYDDHKVKIIGHSLGGGTAALLTYILREQKEFSSTTCVTFAPAACMTWDLAESGKQFISTVINGCDLVPTFSTASIDDLRSEVTASSWLNDLRDQVERTRVLNVVYRSATALGSHLSSIANARARVVGAGALLRPGTQVLILSSLGHITILVQEPVPTALSKKVVMKRAQNVAQAVVRTRSSFSSWSCMGARHRTVGSIPTTEDSAEISLITERSSDVTITEEVITENFGRSKMESSSSNEDTDDEEQLVSADTEIDSAAHITKGGLWLELEKELQRKESVLRAQEEEAVLAKEIIEEEIVLVEKSECEIPISPSNVFENQVFYPPGKIMHMVCVPMSDTNLDGEPTEEHVGIYETARELYSKIRLSKSMINDHYMPMYKKIMEQLIRELEKDDCVIIEA